jgi:hypothetical protein
MIDLDKLEKHVRATGHPFDLTAVSICRDALTVVHRDGGWTYALMGIVLTYAPFTLPIKTAEAKHYRSIARSLDDCLELRRLTPKTRAAEYARLDRVRRETAGYFGRRNGQHG